MPDFQERGAHDYRKDALLTLQEFERIVVRCIVYYNCERVIQNYPYTQDMIANSVRPHANTIWNWKMNEAGANLIVTCKNNLVLTLLPRTNAKFTRHGLKVNQLRYYADGYKEHFLRGDDAIVAYNPDNCNKVWLKEKDGSFVEFSLIESRFLDMSLDNVQELFRKQKELVQESTRENYQAKIELMSFIETVAAKPTNEVQLKGSRAVRKKETRKRHKDVGEFMDE